MSSAKWCAEATPLGETSVGPGDREVLRSTRVEARATPQSDALAPGRGAVVGDLRPEQRNVRDWLKQHRPSLGELYEAAARIIATRRLPGWVRIVAHLVRELRNGLPQAFQPNRKPQTFQWKKKLGEVDDLWTQPIDARGDPGPDRTSSVVDAREPGIFIRQDLYRKLDEMLRKYRESGERVANAEPALIEALAVNDERLRTELSAPVKRFMEAGGWFQKHVHDSGRADADVDRAEFVSRFDQFEDALRRIAMACTGMRHFEVVKKLDGFLDEANRETDS